MGLPGLGGHRSADLCCSSGFEGVGEVSGGGHVGGVGARDCADCCPDEGAEGYEPNVGQWRPASDRGNNGSNEFAGECAEEYARRAVAGGLGQNLRENDVPWLAERGAADDRDARSWSMCRRDTKETRPRPAPVFAHQASL